MAPVQFTPDLQAALVTLLTCASPPMTVRELRDRAGLPIAGFNLAFDELERRDRVTWTKDDLVILPDPSGPP